MIIKAITSEDFGTSSSLSIEDNWTKMLNRNSVVLVVALMAVAFVVIDGAIADAASDGRKTYNKPSSSATKDKVTDDGISPASILGHLDWRSLFSTAIKMMFGNSNEESLLASKQLVSMIISLIDGLRLSFTMKRAQARSVGDTGDELEGALPTADAALAGLSMLKAYVKTITADDQQCVKKYLCQANREAVKDGNQIGFMIAQLGSYATSYMLQNLRFSPFDSNFEAGKEGRNGVNCEARYRQCNEIFGR